MTDPDGPMLVATYGPDDAVMHDNRVMIRSAILLQTAVLGEPVSVSVIYLPAPAWPGTP